MKLYEITIELTIAVAADSEEEALKIGTQYNTVKDELSNICNNFPSADVSIRETKQVPPGWDKDCLVYHNYSDKSNITVQEVLDQLND